jgi:hypothetical protein
MAIRAVGREQLRARFALVEILRLRQTTRQRRDNNGE